ncbi:MAG: hypothetical protein ACI8UO_005203 [Verrucomicrobiales bacterium]|jgi:hypothetical protein
MNRLFQLILLFAPVIAFAQEDDTLEKISATDLEKLEANVGKAAVVTGFIERTGRAGSGINFLNFKDSEFVTVTFAQHLTKFEDGPPAEVYKSKWVEVRGTIEMFKGKPQIKLEDPEQISVIEKPEAAPAETPKPASAAADTEPKSEPTSPLQKPTENPVGAGGKGTELVNGKRPIDWRLYFPE